MLYGRYINEVDIRERRKVCVIGEQVYQEMFMPGENPVRKVVTDKWSGLSGSRCEYSGNENTDRRPFRSIYYFTV